jgi:hypothetical protein
MSYQDYKNRLQNNLGATREQFNKMNKSEFVDDETYWSPARGKDGNGFALVRFLPPPMIDGDDAQPLAKLFRHSFIGPVTGDWYIENCLSSLKEKDPVNELTRILYTSDTEQDKRLAGQYKRKLTVVGNVLIIKDEANPQNEGKVKKFRFGPQILKKIDEAINPKFGKPIDPFNIWTDEGANFGIIVTTEKSAAGDFPNYNSSKFDTPAPLSTDDAYLETICSQAYSLKELLDRKNFKSYDELKTKLDAVLGFTYEERGSAMNVTSAPSVTRVTPVTSASPTVQPTASPLPVTPVVTNKVMAERVEVAAVAADDDEMAYLEALAKKA